MPSKQRYEEAIAAAEADNNPEAAAELRARMAKEHPPKTANPGDRRKARRKASREEAAEADAGFDLSKYAEVDVDRLTKAIEKAEADSNPDAVQELKLVRGIKRAEADGNRAAADELKERLGVKEQAATTRRTIKREADAVRADKKTIKELDGRPVEDLTEEEREQLRSALTRDGERIKAEQRALDDIISGRSLSQADTAKAYGQTLAEAASMGIVGDEVAAALDTGISALFRGEMPTMDQFNTELDSRRAAEAQFRDENKALTIGQDVLGAIGTGAGLYRGAQALSKGSGMLANTAGRLGKETGRVGRIAQAGGLGATEEGVRGFMEGEDGLGNRLASAGRGAAMGAAFGGAGGAVFEGGAAAISAIRNSERQLAEELAEGGVVRKELNLNSGDDTVDTAATVILNDARVQREAIRTGDKADATQGYDDLRRERFLAERGGEGLDEIMLSPDQVRLLSRQLGLDEGDQLRSLDDLLDDTMDGLTIGEIRDFVTYQNADSLNELLGDSLSRVAGEAADAENVLGFMGKLRAVLMPKGRNLETTVGKGFSNTVKRGLIRAQRSQQQTDRVLSNNAPAGRLNQLFVDDKQFASAILNQSNPKLPAKVRENQYNTARQIAKDNGIADFDEIMEDIGKVTDAVSKDAGRSYASVFNDYVNTQGKGKPIYMHTASNKAEAAGLTPGVKAEAKAKTVGALKEAERGFVTPKEVDKFVSPFEAHKLHLDNLINQTELAKSLGLRVAGRSKEGVRQIGNADFNQVVSGEYLEKALRERLNALDGYTPEQIDLAVEGIKDVTVRAEQSMVAELQALRDVTYFGLLAKPFSAVLNVSELGNIILSQGLGNTAKALAKPTARMAENYIKSLGRFAGKALPTDVNNALKQKFGKDWVKQADAFNAESMGLLQTIHNDVVKSLPTGKAVTGIDYAQGAARQTRKALDSAMQVSGTQAIDLGVKETALRAAFNKGRAAQKSPTRQKTWLKENQQFFADDEVALLARALEEADEKTLTKWLNADPGSIEFRKAQLIMDHNMLQLQKIAPTNAIDLPETALRNPNGRALYIFMNYSIKHADWLYENTIRRAKAGDVAGAAKFFAAYTLVTGGLTGAVLEGRDAVWKSRPNDTPTEGPFPEEMSLGNKILWRTGLIVAGNFVAGLAPMSYGYYGTDAYARNPVAEIADDRQVITEIPSTVFEEGKALITEGKYPRRTMQFINPFGRETEAMFSLEQRWRESGIEDWVDGIYDREVDNENW